MAVPETQNGVPFWGKSRDVYNTHSMFKAFFILVMICYDLLLVLNHPFWTVAILTNLTQLRTDCLFTPLPTLQWWCLDLDGEPFQIGNLWSTKAKTLASFVGHDPPASGAFVTRLARTYMLYRRAADVQWNLCSSTAVGEHRRHKHHEHKRNFVSPELRSYLLAVFSHPGLP